MRQEEDTFAAQIKQYYEEGSLPLFQIAFSQLDETAKMVWLERIYTDGQIPFLGGAVNELEIDSAAVSKKHMQTARCPFSPLWQNA